MRFLTTAGAPASSSIEDAVRGLLVGLQAECGPQLVGVEIAEGATGGQHQTRHLAFAGDDLLRQ